MLTTNIELYWDRTSKSATHHIKNLEYLKFRIEDTVARFNQTSLFEINAHITLTITFIAEESRLLDRYYFQFKNRNGVIVWDKNYQTLMYSLEYMIPRISSSIYMHGLKEILLG